MDYMGRNLQDTIAASSVVVGGDRIMPHHPITCSGKLAYCEDGTFACEHVAVPPDDDRTQHALHQSIAVLILEEARKLFGGH